MAKKKLHDKLIKYLVFIVIILIIFYLGFISLLRLNIAQIQMKEEAESLSVAANAVWDYITLNQDKIENTSDGIYEYKGIHCAIAGVSVAKAITLDTDNSIRFVSDPARNPANSMDEIEKEVFHKMTVDHLEEYGQMDELNGIKYYRYFTPIYVEDSCLQCHGTPVGQIDKSGFAKEGYEEGDLIGLTSVSVNASGYTKGLVLDILIALLIFGLLLALFIAIIYRYIEKYVTKPIAKLEDASTELGKGNYDVELPTFEEEDEISSLANHFGKMAEQLEELYNNLEGQVELRTEELAIANKKLQELNKDLQEESDYKSEFLAIMSHELRTPLTAIITYTELLLNSTEDVKNHEVLEDVKYSSEVLLNMINNILEMAKIDAGKSVLANEVVDWMDICGYVGAISSALTFKKNLDFQIYTAPDVPLMMGDTDKLRRMVQNLVSNAFKFSKENGKVSLSIVYDKPNDNILITVEDNGIGISKENLENIFEKFVQIDSSSKRQVGGTGLGLALARSIAQMHGGDISIQSKLDEGSTFIVTIPVKHIGEVSNIEEE